jgi:hypothetical protein
MQGAPSNLQSAMRITAAGYSTMQEALATIARAALFKVSQRRLIIWKRTGISRLRSTNWPASGKTLYSHVINRFCDLIQANYELII